MGGCETGDKVGEVFGMKVAVVPDPIAGTPVSPFVPMGRRHWDATTR